MRRYTVSASFCEHFDMLDCVAPDPEDAKRQFRDRLKAEGHPSWPDQEIQVRDMTDVPKNKTCYGTLLWVKGRFLHGGAYQHEF